MAQAPALADLQHLDHELDLADPAAAELDVPLLELSRGEPAVALVLVPQHLAHRVGSERPAPHEGRGTPQQLAADREVARHRARLEQREALPGGAAPTVVLRGRRYRVGQRARAPLGAQAQVDAVDVSLRGRLSQDRRQVAAERLRVRFGDRPPRRGRRGGRRRGRRPS